VQLIKAEQIKLLQKNKQTNKQTKNKTTKPKKTYLWIYPKRLGIVERHSDE